MEQLSISIVTYQVERSAFAAVLESLTSAIEYFAEFESAKDSAMENAAIEVKIIDNAFQETLLQELVVAAKTQHAHFEVISGLNNIGYGQGHNLAILKSTARYHLILNPDVILDEDCLLEGINYLKSTDEVCAVAPKVVDGNGKIQYLCKQFPSVILLLLRGFAPKTFQSILFSKKLSQYEMRNKIKDKLVEGIPLISGCFMLCDTAVLKKVDGFNKKFFLYFEDYALSMELNKYGKLSYLPSMKICHFGGNSAKKGFKHIFMFASSGIKFFNTYGWKFI